MTDDEAEMLGHEAVLDAEDEEWVTRLCIAYNSVYCAQPEDAKDQPEVMRRAILPIIKAERIRGGEMVKEAAAQDAETWFPFDTNKRYPSFGVVASIRALSVPAIVEAGEHQPKENSDENS